MATDGTLTLCCCLAVQSSVRVDKGSGVPGRTMAEWLVDAGFDAARVRDSSSAVQRDDPVAVSERPSRRQPVHSGMGRPQPPVGEPDYDHCNFICS